MEAVRGMIIRAIDSLFLWIYNFPVRYGNTFKVYMMIIIQLSLMGIAGMIMWTQANQIAVLKSVLTYRDRDIEKFSASEKVRNLLLKEIADKTGVPKDKVFLLLRLDPLAPIRNPDLPPEEILNPERFIK